MTFPLIIQHKTSNFLENALSSYKNIFTQDIPYLIHCTDG